MAKHQNLWDFNVIFNIQDLHIRDLTGMIKQRNGLTGNADQLFTTVQDMRFFNIFFCCIVLLVITFTYSSLSSSENNAYKCNVYSKKENVFDLKESEVSIIASLVDPSTVSKIVKKYYGFEEPVNASILSVGVNDIYLVEADNKKYVLRLSRSNKCLTLTDSEFQFELEWLEFLNQHGVPVSYPIRRLDNQLYGLVQAPEGPRFFALFSFAEGTTAMNPEQAFILGKALAELHMTSDHFQTSLTRERLDMDNLINRPLQNIKEFLKNKDEKTCVLLDKFAENLIKQISDIDATHLNYGIIGGDIHGGNQHFTEDNYLTMFDFEFCAYGYRVYDIATFRWSRGSEHIELWHAFLEGYQSIRKLSDSEIQAIDVFVKARHFWWMGLIVTLSESKHNLDTKFWEEALSRF